MSTVESVVAVLVDDPIENTVHQPYSAYNQGFDAYGLGLKLLVNPYPQGREFDFWDMGWKDARAQEDDEVGGMQSNLEKQWEATAKEQMNKSS